MYVFLVWKNYGCRKTYIPFHRIARQLDEYNHMSVYSATSALLCGHAMSGCDTVSYPFRCGKKKAYKVAMSAAQYITTLSTYGDTITTFVYNKWT